MHDVTRLLDRWNAGDPEALKILISAMYGELRRMAGDLMVGNLSFPLKGTRASPVAPCPAGSERRAAGWRLPAFEVFNGESIARHNCVNAACHCRL